MDYLLILTRRCGPSWTRRQAYGRWQILTAVAERGSCRLHRWGFDVDHRKFEPRGALRTLRKLYDW